MKLNYFIGIVLLLSLFTGLAAAANDSISMPSYKEGAKSVPPEVSSAFDRVTNTLMWFFGGLAVIAIIVSAFTGVFSSLRSNAGGMSESAGKILGVIAISILLTISIALLRFWFK